VESWLGWGNTRLRRAAIDRRATGVGFGSKMSSRGSVFANDVWGGLAWFRVVESRFGWGNTRLRRWGAPIDWHMRGVGFRSIM
jgi:hypothetical protein